MTTEASSGIVTQHILHHHDCVSVLGSDVTDSDQTTPQPSSHSDLNVAKSFWDLFDLILTEPRPLKARMKNKVEKKNMSMWKKNQLHFSKHWL